MKRVFTLCGIVFLEMLTVVAPAQDTTTYYGKMNYVFEHVDKAQITTGLLWDYGIDFLAPDNYSGAALNDSNFVGMQEWRMLYADLYSQQINGNAHAVRLIALTTAL